MFSDFYQVCNLISFAFLPCCFIHVLVSFSSSSIIMFCSAYFTTMPFVFMFGGCSIFKHCTQFVMLLFSTDCIASCLACHFQTMHPFSVIFMSISTEIYQSVQWHAWVTKIVPCSSFLLLSRLHPFRSTSYALHILSCIP